MQFQHPLDAVLNSESKVRILRFFCRKGGEWIGRRLAAELAMNPVTAHKALRALHQATILDFRKVGSNYVYSVRDDHYLVREVFRPLFEREAAARSHLLALLKAGLGTRLRPHIVTVAIYGSLARGQERPRSDIDLIVLVNSSRAKHRVHAALDRRGDDVIKAFGNPLALYVNTVREAQGKARRRLPLFTNILHDHQLVWGKPLQEVLRGHTA
jgi:UTP:GlnB (protein PII) uridylyltransferase